MRKHFFCYSSPTGSLTEAIRDCLDQYEQFLGRFTSPHPLHCVFFTADADNTAYLETKARLSAALGGTFHHFSCIGQAPYRSRLAMEITLLDNPHHEFSVKEKTAGSARYTAIESETEKEIYASGLCGDLAQSIASQTEDVFRQAQEILRAEDMDFSQVYRQWNYIERIIDFDPASQGRKQHYQIFNDIRSDYYANSEFANGFPAATGIGMDCGGIILDIIASRGRRTKHVPIVNPDQLDAHCYTQAVLIGDAFDERNEKSTPKFERAKYVECAYNHSLYISGTAAIKGETTVPSTDIREQTRITLDNISKLHYNESEKWPYRHMRAYVKRPEDIPVVRSMCIDYFGDIPMQFLKADVCRDNLIVEIEAEIDLI